MRVPPLVKLDDHTLEIGLFTVISIGVLVLLGYVIRRGIEGWDVAACLLVLQGIVNKVGDRWSQGTIRAQSAHLGASTPPGPIEARLTNAPDDPVPVEAVR